MPVGTLTPAPSVTETAIRHRPSDAGNAKRFKARFQSRLRYATRWGQWYVWDETRWVADTGCQVLRFGMELAEALHGEAAALAKGSRDRQRMFKHAVDSERAGRIKGMIELAKPLLAFDHRQFDTSPWLLNVRNGTIDLRTGELRPHSPADNLTVVAPVDFMADAPCPKWMAFLDTVFGGNADLIRFVQRYLGYCLTGEVGEQVLLICYGDGANGKSTLIETVMAVLGQDYTASAASNLLLVSRNETHPTAKADLCGKRLVVANEIGSGRDLSEDTVKELTSSQRVKARRMHEDFWEFDPTHKIVLCTNHLPVVAGQDHAIWRRLRVIPFGTRFWNPDTIPATGEQRPAHLRQDKTLGEKLMAEASGILAWMVRGCLDWQREGLGTPAAVHLATTEFRDENDQISRFVSGCCVVDDSPDPPLGETTRSLHLRYSEWCRRCGEVPLSEKKFAKRLADRFAKYTNNGTRYRGLRLQPDDGSTEADGS